MEKKHNGIVSLWKFIFAIVIILFHCNPYFSQEERIFMNGGYIAVEFFFIIAGFYLAKNSQKNSTQKESLGIETIKYIFQTIKKLFPYLLISYILFILIYSIDNNFKMYQLVNSIWNLLLLRQLGFKSVLISAQLWYLSSMLITFFIVYPLLKKYKETFIYIVSPLIALLCLGYLSHNWLSLNHAYQIWDNYYYTGTIRAFAEINLGIFLYGIHNLLKNIKYTKIGQITLTIIGETLLILVLIVAQFIESSQYYDYILLLFIAISTLIITSEKTLDYKILSNNFILYLEKLSMPMFINHMFILELIKKITLFSTTPPQFNATISIIVTIFFSMIELKFINILKKKKILINIKNIFIKNQ